MSVRARYVESIEQKPPTLPGPLGHTCPPKAIRKLIHKNLLRDPRGNCLYNLQSKFTGFPKNFKELFWRHSKNCSPDRLAMLCGQLCQINMAASNSRVDELTSYFKTHNKIKEQQSHSAKVHSVGWSCDGRLLASGSFDKCVCIFSLGTDRLKQETTFRGHGGSVDQLCWHSFHPELLSTASGDKTMRIWDTRSQKCTANIATRGENINISWSPDGNTIAVGNKEDLVTFIDARVMKIRAEEQFNFEVNEISWNKDSDTFYLTNGQGCVHILSYPDLELLHVIKAHPGTCICIEFDPTGRYFATGSADALVSLWDADELCCLRTFSRLEWPVRTISFSHDGQLLAAASEDLVIDIGEVETGEKVADIPVEAATFTVAWHPKQYLLAYACDDKDTYDRKRDAGSLKVFGFSSE
ncbi:THO complex subunit 3 [Neodiprion pinetum]|uniref:THO complex subunit 3 n=1 Tax=Neodiprion pinetum TaxID=441929 RepID=UPI001EDD7BFD|nr:THO complex subunit 3 [Neodiprion pinetum]